MIARDAENFLPPRQRPPKWTLRTNPDALRDCKGPVCRGPQPSTAFARNSDFCRRCAVAIRRRLRWDSDPAYRRRERKKAREHYRQKAKDPEYRAMLAKRRRLRYRHDAEFRENWLEGLRHRRAAKVKNYPCPGVTKDGRACKRRRLENGAACRWHRAHQVAA